MLGNHVTDVGQAQLVCRTMVAHGVLLHLLLSMYVLAMYCLWRLTGSADAATTPEGKKADSAVSAAAEMSSAPPSAGHARTNFSPPMASPEEQQVINAAVDILNASAETQAKLQQQQPLRPEMLKLQLLRHLRGPCAKAPPEALAASFVRAWDRRNRNRLAVVQRGAAKEPWAMAHNGGRLGRARRPPLRGQPPVALTRPSQTRKTAWPSRLLIRPQPPRPALLSAASSVSAAVAA